MSESIVNRQSSIVNREDFVPIDEAADLTHVSISTWRRRAIAQAARGSLAYQAAPRGGTGRPTWWVHRSLHPRLTRYPNRATRDDHGRAALLERYPGHRVDLAYRKNHWLQRWRSLCGALRPAGVTDRDLALDVVAEARRTENESFRISVRSLQIWWRSYNELDENGRVRGIEALVPQYTNGGATERDAAAIDYFYAIYHSRARETIRTCHEATLREARRAGWSWPAGYTATVKWLSVNDRLDETCLYREGTGPYSNRYLPHLEIDWTTIEPGFWYVTDHTQVDFWCTFDGRQLRGWLTSIIDCRSRCAVGWHFGDSPHQDAILAAMRMAFRDWAVPGRIRIDRGADFCSELITGSTKRDRIRHRRELGPDWQNILRHNREVFWTGVLGELDIEIIYALPRHPWSKGIVERWYGTFEDGVARQFPTYTGNRPEHRPDCIGELRADPEQIPTSDEVRTRIADWIDLYHGTPHRGLEGATPLSVWQSAGELRKAIDNELLALMQSRGVYRVGGNGVSFRIGSKTYHYGAGSAALRRLTGRDVFITLDPADCSCCYAYTADPDNRHFVARLESNERLPADTSVEELRRASAEIGRRRKLFNRAGGEAARRLRTAAQEVRALRREQVAEIRKTGTDDTAAAPNIVPVRTRFEGASKPVRAGFERGGSRSVEPVIFDMDDLFDGEETIGVVKDRDDGRDIEDLFIDEPKTDTPDEGLEDLL